MVLGLCRRFDDAQPDGPPDCGEPFSPSGEPVHLTGRQPPDEADLVNVGTGVVGRRRGQAGRVVVPSPVSVSQVIISPCSSAYVFASWPYPTR